MKKHSKRRLLKDVDLDRLIQVNSTDEPMVVLAHHESHTLVAVWDSISVLDSKLLHSMTLIIELPKWSPGDRVFPNLSSHDH